MVLGCPAGYSQERQVCFLPSVQSWIVRESTGSSRCVPCPAGTASNMLAGSSLRRVLSGTQPKEGQINCVDCSPGACQSDASSETASALLVSTQAHVKRQTAQIRVGSRAARRAGQLRRLFSRTIRTMRAARVAKCTAGQYRTHVMRQSHKMRVELASRNGK